MKIDVLIKVGGNVRFYTSLNVILCAMGSSTEKLSFIFTDSKMTIFNPYFPHQSSDEY